MQKKSSYKWLHLRRSLAMHAFSYCFVSFILFLFCSFQPAGFSNSQIGYKTAFVHDQHLAVTAAARNCIHLPYEAVLPAQLVDMEEVVEEDESENSFTDSCTQFVPGCFVAKLLCFDSIKSRFLHLAATYQNRPKIPFFILHHSWKLHLS